MKTLPTGEKVVAEDDVWELIGKDSGFKKFVEYCLTRFTDFASETTILMEVRSMYYGHTVAPEIETFMDNAAKDLTGNEVANDKDSYNMGYYNGAMDMARYLSKYIFGCEVIIERDPELDGMHVVKPD